MRGNLPCLILLVAALLTPIGLLRGADDNSEMQVTFHTSDRCMACHNQLTTPSGKDISIGTTWRASIMANSARDPYWQGSVRRETMDHPDVTEEIQNECSICHMPITRYEAVSRGRKGKILGYLPFTAHKQGAIADEAAAAEDGVTCSVCHQISKERLGTRESFTGQFVIERPKSNDDRPEFGPFLVTPGHQKIMDSSTGGFRPQYAEHIRDSALCGSCHQLYTVARGEAGKEIGSLPEQVPYLEWLHSDYPRKHSCQGCHMPEVTEDAPISSVLGVPRAGVHRHTFVGANFFMLDILNRYRDELDVTALPHELTAASEETLDLLHTQSAKLELRNIETVAGRLQAEVYVQNLTGHKLPTAYPSRRAWVHFVVHDHDGRVVFESGKLNPDGSIQGNDNDADKSRYEPHYREITSPEQVEIFEDILQDEKGQVTTGLLAGVGYIKDNRLLPAGFDKKTAIKDVAVIGDAWDDPNFTAGGDLIRYSVPLGEAQSPFHTEVELWYQPIGYRWAHNLEPYQATEPQRFVSYYKSTSSTTATVLARAEATK